MSIATASSDSVFEVQQLRSGNWGCVSTYHSRSDAVEEAKGLFEQYQHIQARVVHEAFDDASERYVKKIIFRSQPPIVQHKSQETPQDAAYSRLAARAKSRNQKDKRQRAEKAARQLAARRNTSFYAKLVVFLILIGGGGLAALYALYTLSL
jgi:hypothetical protein